MQRIYDLLKAAAAGDVLSQTEAEQVRQYEEDQSRKLRRVVDFFGGPVNSDQIRDRVLADLDGKTVDERRDIVQILLGSGSFTRVVHSGVPSGSHARRSAGPCSLRGLRSGPAFW